MTDVIDNKKKILFEYLDWKVILHLFGRLFTSIKHINNIFYILRYNSEVKPVIIF